MGRGRSAATTAATASTSAAASTTNSTTGNISKLQRKSTKATAANEKEPTADDGDESSQDSSVRKTRRSLTNSKEQGNNALPKTIIDLSLNKRARQRKSTQLNNTTLSLSESKAEVEEEEEEEIINNSHASNSNNPSTIEVADIEENLAKLVGDHDDLAIGSNVIICDAGESNSAISSTLPDSTDATPSSADDELTTFVISDDSQTQSSSIIVNIQDDSNSVQIIETEVRKMDSPNVESICKKDDRLLVSPDFLQVPKSKTIRTYQNRRKLKNDETTPNFENKSVPKTATEIVEKPCPEVTECRRSQRKKIMKYDVRDLFKIKGSRTDARNGKTTTAAQKLRDAKRSESDSSPQNFIGFSDPEDRPSPVNMKRGSMRVKSIAAPILSQSIVPECNKASILRKFTYETPTQIVNRSTATNSPILKEKSMIVSQKTAEEPLKVTKVALKKEPQKPSRILPRRKTVLLNRCADIESMLEDSTDNIKDSNVDASSTKEEIKQDKLHVTDLTSKENKFTDTKVEVKQCNEARTENQNKDESDLNVTPRLETSELVDDDANLEVSTKTVELELEPCKKTKTEIEIEEKKTMYEIKKPEKIIGKESDEFKEKQVEQFNEEKLEDFKKEMKTEELKLKSSSDEKPAVVESTEKLQEKLNDSNQPINTETLEVATVSRKTETPDKLERKGSMRKKSEKNRGRESIVQECKSNIAEGKIDVETKPLVKDDTSEPLSENKTVKIEKDISKIESSQVAPLEELSASAPISEPDICAIEHNVSNDSVRATPETEPKKYTEIRVQSPEPEKKPKSKAALKCFDLEIPAASDQRSKESEEEKRKKKSRRSHKEKSTEDTDRKSNGPIEKESSVKSDESNESSATKSKKKSKKAKQLDEPKEIHVINGVLSKQAINEVATQSLMKKSTKVADSSSTSSAKTKIETSASKESHDSKHPIKSKTDAKLSRRSGHVKPSKDTEIVSTEDVKETVKLTEKPPSAKENGEISKSKERVSDAFDFAMQLSLADSISTKSSKEGSKQSKIGGDQKSSDKKPKKKKKDQSIELKTSEVKKRDEKKSKKSTMKSSLKQQLEEVAMNTPGLPNSEVLKKTNNDLDKSKIGNHADLMFKRNRTLKENEELKSQKKRRISKLYTSVDAINEDGDSKSAVKLKQDKPLKVEKVKKPSRWSDVERKDDQLISLSDVRRPDNPLEMSPTDLLSELKRAQLAEMESIPTVLNGLSNTVMNDLIAWTCNNKETVSRIKDTFENQQIANRNQETVKKLEEISSGRNIVDNARSFLNTLLEDKALVAQSKQLKEITAEANEAAETLSDVKEKLAEDGLSFEDPFDSRDSSAASTPIPSTPIDEIRSKSYDTDTSMKSDFDQSDQSSMDGSINIRRSHRLKIQTKSNIVGRGLVRDRDTSKSETVHVYTKNSELDAQNAKFLKDMEERLSQFQMIKENEYKCERIISKEAKRMNCDCFLTREEEERGEMGCGEDCLNRLLMIECSSNCNNGDRCTNRRFQKNHYAPCKVFRTEKKGFGIMADANIAGGEFIMEYVGEVLNGKQFEKRAAIYSQDKNKHYYFMALRGDSIIDATGKGSISRFINHSCDPNAETQKWTVNGELRIGFFSKRKIGAGEEITFDYQFQRYGKEAQKCFCESANCRGWIGEEPDSEEEEEEEESSSESEEEIEEKLPEDDVAKAKMEPELLDIEQVEGVIVPSEKPIKVETKAAAEKRMEKSARKALKAAERFERIAAKMKAKKERDRLKQEKRMAMEDADLDAEVTSLSHSGLKNQAHTLRFNRCMVRVKSMESRLNLLTILRNGEMPCRRLFLDYHGLRLLHGWMCEIETTDKQIDLEFRRLSLETLEVLPIPNKTMLKESKVFQTVERWKNNEEQEISPSDSPTDMNEPQSSEPPIKKAKIDDDSYAEIRSEIRQIASKLVSAWEELPEVFRIPKRERIEQMKEHEREADRQYKALNLVEEDQWNMEMRNKERFGAKKNYKWGTDKYDRDKRVFKEPVKLNSAEAGLSKLQRRQLFAAKVAKDEAEKRLAEERREFDFKCRFYGLDPRYANLHDIPFCVQPSTGQWFTKDMRKIVTPPSHAHIKVPPKPQSTDPKDYKMPALDLPPMWKYALDPQGRIYYYHVKIRIPQWEPPIKILPLTGESEEIKSISMEVASTSGQVPNEPQPSTSKQAMSTNSDTSTGETDESDSDISCSAIVGLKKGVAPKIGKEMIDNLRESRKRKRYIRLVQERTISPRREEDRLYNQIEMRRYRENKEKIRRRKEEIKRRKAQLLRSQQQQQGQPGGDTSTIIVTESGGAQEKPSSPSESAVDNFSLPIQDYLLSSDEDDSEKPDYNNSLLEKIVHGDKIVDELDAITKEKPLKRPLTFVKDRIEAKKRQKLEEKKRQLENITKSSAEKAIKQRKITTESTSSKNQRRAKEKFRTEIAGIIVQHLTPYRRESCPIGRIVNDEDFKHLARKLTHFVLIKENKHCDSTGQLLVVTESVKNKSRDFIKKYMAKYGEIYIRPENDPEFRDIPH